MLWQSIESMGLQKILNESTTDLGFLLLCKSTNTDNQFRSNYQWKTGNKHLWCSIYRIKLKNPMFMLQFIVLGGFVANQSLLTELIVCVCFLQFITFSSIIHILALQIKGTRYLTKDLVQKRNMCPFGALFLKTCALIGVAPLMENLRYPVPLTGKKSGWFNLHWVRKILLMINHKKHTGYNVLHLHNKTSIW